MDLLIDLYYKKALLKFFIVLSNITQVPEYINDILLIYQIYEWMIMIHMMVYQNGKQLQDIIYQISNYQSRQTFRRTEDICKYIIWLLVVIYTAFYCVWFYSFYELVNYRLIKVVELSKDVISSCLLTLTGLVLLLLLYKKYYFEFNR